MSMIHDCDKKNVPPFTGGAGRPREPSIPSVSTPEGRTDLANSRRFVADHRHRVRHCHQWGRWLCWDGRRWVVDDTGNVIRLAKDTVDAIWNRSRTLEDSASLRWAARSASSAGIAAMLKLAESEVPVSVAELDRDPWLLNCPNGTVDLRTGNLQPHQSEDYITRLCPVEFDPSSQAPTWDKFQRDVAGGDEQLVRFKQQLYGYAATGDVREQILPIGWGPGGNGKSTEIDAISGALGPDYCGTLPRSLLMVSAGDRHPTELTTLFGKRLMIAHETDDGGRLSEALVKQLTGGDAITARGMRQDFWTFPATHKLLMLTNHKPRVRGTDHAIWRRLRLIPYTARFEGETRDKSMPERLRNEATGILNWIVAGCLEWQKRGLAEPEAVTVATADYRTNEDTVATFILEGCLTGGHFKAKAGQLYEAYKSWCESSGERALSQRRFGEGMTERGYARTTSNGIWYLGIGIRDA